jgi:hypothetical protein
MTELNADIPAEIPADNPAAVVVDQEEVAVADEGVFDWDNPIDPDAPLNEFGKAADDVIPAESIYDMFETDPELEENGKWFQIKGEAHIKLRRATSKISVAVSERIQRAWTSANGTKEPSDVDAEVMLCRQLADGMIVDWEGIRDRDGVEIPFSSQAAYSLIRAIAQVRTSIAGIVVNMEEFKNRELWDIEKNS